MLQVLPGCLGWGEERVEEPLDPLNPLMMMMMMMMMVNQETHINQNGSSVTLMIVGDHGKQVEPSHPYTSSWCCHLPEKNKQTIWTNHKLPEVEVVRVKDVQHVKPPAPYYIITGSLLKDLISTRDPEFFSRPFLTCLYRSSLDLDDEQFIHSHFKC